ncbi:hypothetical protein CHUAL_011964 [Chamberlinius hualienensis]
MADSVDIDLYDEELEPDFNQEGDYNHDGSEDLYDDVITAPAGEENDLEHGDDLTRLAGQTPGGGKKVSLYVGNLTWWTTDKDITDAVHSLGVTDLVDIKFYENRANGQSKGFCVLILGSEQSSRIVLEKLPKKELHGQAPAVTHCNRQTLNQFEMQSRKANQGNGSYDPYDEFKYMPNPNRGQPLGPPRGMFPVPPRNRSMPPHFPPPLRLQGSVMGGPHVGGPPPVYHPQHDYHPVPPGMRPNGPHGPPPNSQGMHQSRMPHPGGPPPPPGLPGNMPPRPGPPPPVMPQGHGMPPRGPGPDPRGPPPRPDWNRPPGPGFVSQQPPPVGPLQASGPPPSRPPPGVPPPSHLPPPGQAPAPHINPAFFPPQHAQPPPAGLPANTQSGDIYNRPPPVQYGEYRSPET